MPSPALPLTGQTALVTGASRGIGLACARKLAALGAHVETAERSTGFDLADPADALRAVERLDRLDILVCNAGRVDRVPLTELSLETWQQTLSLNLTAPFVMGQAAARAWLAARESEPERPPLRIVHICSMRSFIAGTGVAAYTASKTALASLAKAQASEWAQHGIRVNGVAPGWVETDLTATWRETPELEASIMSRVPAGRWAQPEEIAEAVAWLVQPASGFVNGHVLAVDGGYLTR